MSRRSGRTGFMWLLHARKLWHHNFWWSTTAAHCCRKAPYRTGNWEQMCCNAGESRVSLEPLHVKIKAAKQRTAAKGADRRKRGSNRSVNPPSENPLRRWVTGKIWAALYVNPLKSTSASVASARIQLDFHTPNRDQSAGYTSTEIECTAGSKKNLKLPGVGLSFKWGMRGMAMQTWKTCEIHTIIPLLLGNNSLYSMCRLWSIGEDRKATHKP